MWIKRSEYERLLQSEASAQAAVAEIRAAVAASLEEAERVCAELITKAEARTEKAEAALVVERQENRRAERHWASMFLRREKTYPLPPTKEEKAEATAEKEQRANEPPKLTPDQEARKAAAIAWGIRNGFTEEQAEQSFMAQLSQQVDE